MTPPGTAAQNNYILERLDLMKTDLQTDIADLKTDVRDLATGQKCLNDNLTAFQREYVGEHVKVVTKADAAHQRLDKLEERIKEIEKLLPFMKAEAYILTALAIPVILGVLAFIWSLLTHQAVIIP